MDNAFTFPILPDADRLPALSAYAARLTGAYDDFFEEKLLSSQTHSIMLGGERIGLCALLDGDRLTAFWLAPAYARLYQRAFAAARQALSATCAYVATGDEPFLSVCMDAHAAVGLQAYFFLPGVAAVRAPEWGRELFSVAKPEDQKDILDHYDGVAENIRLGKYFVLRKDGEFLGQGFFSMNPLTPGRASIGMSVHPDHRRQGVGRSIILHLADVCRERGLIACCGCAYTNDNSRRTLESAGFVSTTRYLDIQFKQ